MAKCDTGYFCEKCGEYVDTIQESALYLRYVLGEVPFEELFSASEAHIRCVPELARLIEHPDYDPPENLGESPTQEGPDLGRTAARVTRAWQRLRAIPYLELSIEDYPLADEAGECGKIEAPRAQEGEPE